MRGKKSLIALIWAIVIFILSIIPGKDLPELDINYFDKLAHATVYAILSFLILLACPSRTLNVIFLWAFLLPVSYGIMIELFQGTFLNDRITDVYDMIANAIGSLVVSILAYLGSTRHVR